MPRAQQLPRVHRYSLEFKLSAVKLSKLPGVQVQDVAQALDIHPFMLSRWRKDARDGRLRGNIKKVELSRKIVGQLRQLSELQRRYSLLKQEHELLKKAIRFCSQAKRRSLPSSMSRVVNSQ
jgi:transposase